MKRRICIISFSPIYRDARVLRQVRYLSSHYKLKVIGIGPEPCDCGKNNNIQWRQLNVSEQGPVSLLKKLNYVFHLLISRDWDTLIHKVLSKNVYFGQLFPILFDKVYWCNPLVRCAFEFSISNSCDAFLANDWNALPVAVEAARRLNAHVVFDAHEYAPLEYNNLYWRLNHSPMIRYLLRKYCPHVDASTTVAPQIAERYRRAFKLAPTLVMNAPDLTQVPQHNIAPQRINLVHHGGAFRIRRLEEMIKTVKLSDARYHLHFILTGQDEDYVRYLKHLAEKLASGRVHFHRPVTPAQVVERISEYDISFCYIPPTNYNYEVSLPNKFFDSIVAGLALIIGPSPEMAVIVRKYRLGRVASSFRPHDLAEELNRLTVEEIVSMRKASRKAAGRLNAETEMRKLVDIFRQLFAEKDD